MGKDNFEAYIKGINNVFLGWGGNDCALFYWSAYSFNTFYKFVLMSFEAIEFFSYQCISLDLICFFSFCFKVFFFGNV